MCCRQLKAIDFDALRQDVEKSELCAREYSDLNELTSSYNSTLTSLLDKHALMKEKVVVCRQRLAWFNSEIKCAIRTRRKAERKWRRTKSQQDFRAFKGARNRATFVMNGARCEYYTSLIAENSSNQRNLFRTTKSLLCEPSGVSFPKDIAPDDIANDFGNFFMQKIDKINQLIDMQSSRLKGLHIKSQHMDSLLQPIAKKQESYLKDTTDFLLTSSKTRIS